MIFENADQIQFFTPVHCIVDAKKYLPEILRSKGVESPIPMEMLDLLLVHVEALENDWLEDHASEAKARLFNRDPDDWPVLAAALALSCPIWTHDTDFFGVGVATWTTAHIPGYFNS